MVGCEGGLNAQIFLQKGCQNMNDFKELPKSVKKTIRYLQQDADLEQLMKIEKMLVKTIKMQKDKLSKTL